MESEVRPAGVQLKRKAKNASRDWVDHQACSLLKYINVIANLFYQVSFCS